MDWTTMMAASWAQLQGGDILGAAISANTNVMGMWFYAFVMMIGMTMLYLRTNNYGTVATVGMLISAAAIPFMPTQTLNLIFIMIALGMTIILYRSFHK